jgi:hypothetical protein
LNAISGAFSLFDDARRRIRFRVCSFCEGFPMFTTEKEAAAKRCTPIAAAIVTGVATQPDSTKRNAAWLSLASGGADRCIGSLCAQWRWRTPAPGERGNQFENGDRKGYCGLAGSPPVTL